MTTPLNTKYPAGYKNSEKDIEIENGFLKCPVCGCYDTHQLKVHVFFRTEGSDTGNHATIDREFIKAIPNMKGNPSPYRDGIIIEMYGECGHSFDLLVYQHKGQTNIKTVRECKYAGNIRW
jgi:hypothetical protein